MRINNCIIGIGSNIDAEKNIAQALNNLKNEVTVKQIS